jgi:hypothetical protein
LSAVVFIYLHIVTRTKICFSKAKIIQPELISKWICNLYFTMIWDIDLIFGIWVYNHKVQIKFEIRSGWMICGQLIAVDMGSTICLGHLVAGT